VLGERDARRVGQKPPQHLRERHGKQGTQFGSSSVWDDPYAPRAFPTLGRAWNQVQRSLMPPRDSDDTHAIMVV
jgi:hypothetical protein